MVTAIQAENEEEEEEERSAGQEGWKERHFLRVEFWRTLLERSKGKTNLFGNITPGRDHFITTGAGRSGIVFAYVVLKDGGQVELYIDHDKEDGRKNKAIFDSLFSEKAAIEQEFEGQLEWQRLDGRRSARIAKKFLVGGLKEKQSWPALQDSMIDAMIRLDRTLRQRIARLRV